MGRTPFVLPDGVLETLRVIFANYPELDKVVLYGSRATGQSTPRSDIDLVTFGLSDLQTLGRLDLDLEDSDILQKCDVQAYEHLKSASLKRHIDGEGITLFERPLPD